MTRFSDAALLKGDFAHMAAEFRAGERDAPKNKDWNKTASDTGAELAAQEVAKHIFALQQGIDPKKHKLHITAMSATGPIRVMNLAPGEGDILRVDGVTADNQPIAQVLHTSQLALTFTVGPIEETENADDDGLDIGFVIFEELKDRKKKRTKKKRKLSLSTSRTIKTKPRKSAAPKKAAK